MRKSSRFHAPRRARSSIPERWHPHGKQDQGTAGRTARQSTSEARQVLEVREALPEPVAGDERDPRLPPISDPLRPDWIVQHVFAEIALLLVGARGGIGALRVAILPQSDIFRRAGRDIVW